MRASTAGPLPPGSVIGILGGGQLGRMTALAAARFGYLCHVFTPEEDSPAAQVSARATLADWRDEDALRRFAEDCDVVTYEFENIPAQVVRSVAGRAPVRPGEDVLTVCQDRIEEKRFLGGIGVPTTRWRPVASAVDLPRALASIGRPAVLKTARLGYDGKGQVAIDAGTDLEAAWTEMAASAAVEGGAGGNPAGLVQAPAVGILEAWVTFETELSVVVARSRDGVVASYVPVENIHEGHVLRRTLAPARITPSVARRADALARHVADALGLVGVLAVEMFLGPGDRLLVNELAPRPHNSGHWTIDACECSQFEQCVRAVAGLPLGPTGRHADAVMENLLGTGVDRWRELVADPDARVHLYGKREARPGRKMGHVTWLTARR